MGKKQSKRICSVLFDLPNEVFIEIFSYLNGVDAVFAFGNVNRRFQCLLLESCQYFNLKSISKMKFDFICEEYRIERCKSLRLCNNEYSRGQIGQFFRCYRLMEFCCELECLSLLKIESCCPIFDQFPFLINLHSLTIKSICGRTMRKFSLPKLRRLVLRSCRNTQWIEVSSFTNMN
jgi:hypothetical protein